MTVTLSSPVAFSVLYLSKRYEASATPSAKASTSAFDKPVSATTADVVFAFPRTETTSAPCLRTFSSEAESVEAVTCTTTT